MSSNEEKPIAELLWKELNDLKRENKMLKLEKAKRLHKDGYRCWVNMEDAKAVDKLSEACDLYEEVYDKSSKKLGKFYILYAKSLKYFASDSTKIIGDCGDYFDKNDAENDDNEWDEWNEDSDDDDYSESKENVESNIEAKIVNNEPHGTTVESNDKIENKEIMENEKSFTEKVEDMSKSTQEESQESSSKDDSSDSERERNEFVNTIQEHSSMESIEDGEKLTSNNEESFENAENMEDDVYVDASKLKVGQEKLRLAKEIFEGLGKDGLKNLDEVERLLAKFETPNDIEKRREIIRREYNYTLRLSERMAKENHFFLAKRFHKNGLDFIKEQLNDEGLEALKKSIQLLEQIKSKNYLHQGIRRRVDEIKKHIQEKIIKVEKAKAQDIIEVNAIDASTLKSSSADAALLGPSLCTCF
uniref:Uncharacterized protein n=1 Tax=Glossina pallidipes TaxID=7398 RepID=A0A1A9ZLY1_GLOPL